MKICKISGIAYSLPDDLRSKIIDITKWEHEKESWDKIYIRERKFYIKEFREKKPLTGRILKVKDIDHYFTTYFYWCQFFPVEIPPLRSNFHYSSFFSFKYSSDIEYKKSYTFSFKYIPK